MSRIMEEITEEIRVEAKEEGRMECAMALLEDGRLSLPDIARMTNLAFEDVEQLAQTLATTI